MGLEKSGKPTWDFGTVEQANEDDAVVEWDRDGAGHSPKSSSRRFNPRSGWADLQVWADPANFGDLL
jgi:hypothetical protein